MTLVESAKLSVLTPSRGRCDLQVRLAHSGQQSRRDSILLMVQPKQLLPQHTWWESGKLGQTLITILHLRDAGSWDLTLRGYFLPR